MADGINGAGSDYFAYPHASILHEQRFQPLRIHGIACRREVDVVRGEEVLLDRAVGVGEICGEIENLHLGIAVEFERIEGGVGLLDVLVKAIPRRMSG
jgi:hypothetical protein